MMPKLLALFRANANRPRERRAVAAAAGKNAEIHIDDVIGYDWWTDSGITDQWFNDELKALRVGAGDVVDVYVNSPGGDVFEARAMVATMNRHPATFSMHVTGQAASAASFFVMHGDDVEITAGAFLMIHNSWTMALGNRHDMGKAQSLLAQIDASIVADYAERTGIDASELAAMMDEETWIDAETAVARGFADRIQAKAQKAKASARWDLSAYKHPPAALVGQSAPDPDAAVTAHFEHLQRRFALLSATPA